MKLNEKQTLYVATMGKALRVTAVCNSVEEANAYMETHPDDALVAEFGPYLFIAHRYDTGIPINDGRERKRYRAGSGQVRTKGAMYERTGDFRAPREGEWYLSGAIPEAYRAPNDLNTPYHILREV